MQNTTSANENGCLSARRQRLVFCIRNIEKANREATKLLTKNERKFILWFILLFNEMELMN